MKPVERLLCICEAFLGRGRDIPTKELETSHPLGKEGERMSDNNIFNFETQRNAHLCKGGFL